MPIHATAIIDRHAEIDPSADVGPHVVIEAGVRVGPETRIYPFAYVAAGTRLGARCRIHPFAVVGHLPQDLKFGGAASYTEIGDETIVREHAQIHRGTEPDSTTRVGRRCFIMATAHIGHNCVVEDDVKLANGALLSGHVHVGRAAFVSGNSVVQQFARIGELAMIGGLTRVPDDVPPFLTVTPAGVVGPNTIGLRRAGLTGEERQEIRECYRLLYRSELLFRDAIARVIETARTPAGRRMAEFLRGPSQCGYMSRRSKESPHGGMEAGEPS